MIPLPLALCVFDSSKGHFGRADIYRRTITDLDARCPLNHFKRLIVHVKVCPGEESVFAEQKRFYEERGFTVLSTVEEWSHFSESHQRGYSRDLITVYGDQRVVTVPYALHMESDWLLRARGDHDLVDYFGEAMSYLAQNPAVLTVRFPRFLNEIDRLNGLRAKHGMDVRTEREGAPWQKFWRHNDNLSLNPTIFRSRDLYAATRLMKRDFARMGGHVEHSFTHCLSWMSDGQLPYALFDPSEVGALHIGTKTGEEDPEGGAYDR